MCPGRYQRLLTRQRYRPLRVRFMRESWTSERIEASAFGSPGWPRPGLRRSRMNAHRLSVCLAFALFLLLALPAPGLPYNAPSSGTIPTYGGSAPLVLQWPAGVLQDPLEPASAERDNFGLPGWLPCDGVPSRQGCVCGITRATWVRPGPDVATAPHRRQASATLLDLPGHEVLGRLWWCVDQHSSLFLGRAGAVTPRPAVLSHNNPPPG